MNKLLKTVIVPFYLISIFMLAVWQEKLALLQRLSEQEKTEEKATEEKAGREADGLEPGEILGNEKGLLLPQNLPHNKNTTKYSGNPKIILTWTQSFDQSHLNGCPDWNCKLTSDRALASDAEAVIFYNGIADWNTIQNIRKPHQYFVFFTQESPVHMGVREPIKGFLNLTMGFRRDADLPCPYGYSYKRFKELSEGEMNEKYGAEAFASKTKKVAWFVSNCDAPSKRMDYVRELQNHIEVDIYGSCGNLTCKKDTKNTCTKMLGQTYFFYMALENSICKDYITEKFWEKGADGWPIVPIVLKRSLVESFAPNGSFIALDDFPSPKRLAEYLNKVSNDMELYSKFFKWRKNYEIVFLNGRVHDIKERPWGFCRLCQLLWETPRPNKIVKNLSEWWKTGSACDQSLVPKLLREGT